MSNKNSSQKYKLPRSFWVFVSAMLCIILGWPAALFLADSVILGVALSTVGLILLIIAVIMQRREQSH